MVVEVLLHHLPVPAVVLLDIGSSIAVGIIV